MKLFQNEDGSISTSKVSAYLGVALILHIWIDTRYIGLQYDMGLLEFWLEIIVIALGLRGVDRFSRYGLSNLGTLAGVKKKGETTNDQPKEVSQKETKKPNVKKTTAQKPKPTRRGNFQLHEFDSKDGAAMPNDVRANIEMLIENLEVIREACGNKPMPITSGYRSRAHNTKVGGAKNSQHMVGNAADFRVQGLTPTKVSQIVEKLMDEGKIEQGGIGLYVRKRGGFVHYDRRGTKTKWVG